MWLHLEIKHDMHHIFFLLAYFSLWMQNELFCFLPDMLNIKRKSIYNTEQQWKQIHHCACIGWIITYVLFMLCHFEAHIKNMLESLVIDNNHKKSKLIGSSSIYSLTSDLSSIFKEQALIWNMQFDVNAVYVFKFISCRLARHFYCLYTHILSLSDTLKVWNPWQLTSCW